MHVSPSTVYAFVHIQPFVLAAAVCAIWGDLTACWWWNGSWNCSGGTSAAAAGGCWKTWRNAAGVAAAAGGAAAAAAAGCAAARWSISAPARLALSIGNIKFNWL